MWHASWSAARYATSETPRTGVPTRGVVARAPTAAPVGTAYRAVVARGLTPAPVAGALAAPAAAACNVVAPAPNAAPVADALTAPVPVASVARTPNAALVAGALAAPADAVVPVADEYWRINGNVVGNIVDATVFAVQLFGLENVDCAMSAKLKGMTIRMHINGLFVVSDVVKLFLIKDLAYVRRWINKHVNISTSPSLTYVASGHKQVTLLKLAYNLYHQYLWYY